MEEVIRLENIAKKINGKIILNEINLSINKGENFGVFGPSGCGKTTLLRIIAGLDKPDEGSVYLRGMNATSGKIFVPPEKRNISFVFQDLGLWPHMSVKEHLEFVLDYRNKGRIKGILKACELGKHENLRPEEISGGEKQRLAIARAVAQKSDILLLDEPFSSLDLSVKEEMKRLLKKLQNKYNLTVAYVTHDILEVIDMCDRIAIMTDGRIENVGYPSKLLKNQFLKIKSKLKSSKK